MYTRKTHPRSLQQQPSRYTDTQQQQAGSTDFQPRQFQPCKPSQNPSLAPVPQAA